MIVLTVQRIDVLKLLESVVYKMIWLAYASAWIATSVAVIAGIYLTGSAWCLWAFFIPSATMDDCAKIYISNQEGEEEDENEMAD